MRKIVLAAVLSIICAAGIVVAVVLGRTAVGGGAAVSSSISAAAVVLGLAAILVASWSEPTARRPVRPPGLLALRRGTTATPRGFATSCAP